MRPEDRGLYVLVIKLEKGQRIKAAKLPETYFKRGLYLYVGRAKRGLKKRVGRHLRRDKKLFWHIDYFLQRSKVDEVWIKHDSFDECLTIEQIRELLRVSVYPQKKFGASDCCCPSHLLYLPGVANPCGLRKKLAFGRAKINGI
jgi:Uri superfamily endonuclease